MRFNRKNNRLSLSISGKYRLDELTHMEQQPLNREFPFSQLLQQLLTGKKLLLEEISVPVAFIEEHYKQGYVKYHQGIVKNQCQRCGNVKAHLFHTYVCGKCGENCTYCRNCITMGRVAQCTPLISWAGPTPLFSPSSLQWDGTLSMSQQNATNFLLQAVEESTDALVWAVCGAGKTEILFSPIQKALTTGKRVCVATPRADVVRELEQRLKEVFPKTPIASLYGGTKDRELYAPLVIATTHQLLRFANAFDVMIVDEVDAFPYTFDESLQRAVEIARKKHSAQIFLTATPSKLWQKEVHQGKRRGVIISARYHANRLPVPTFIWSSEKKIFQWINKHLHKRPILLFVPQVATMHQVTEKLQKLDENITSVHAEDKDRKEKVAKFRKQEIPLLVTTTILERGITIENVQVAVLEAENKIFSESALVQIAGRVGRSGEFPSGDVVFFHRGKSDAMVEAKKHIEQMNRKAKKEGLIN